jgi:hypothetical protein
MIGGILLKAFFEQGAPRFQKQICSGRMENVESEVRYVRMYVSISHGYIEYVVV